MNINKNSNEKKERTILKAVGSVLFAVIASSHHWLHTLLIAVGLTTLGTGLFALPPAFKLLFLLISFALSLWFIRVARKKWNQNRPAAWVYLISSVISIVLVATAMPQTVTDLTQPEQPQQLQLQDQPPPLQDQQPPQEQPTQDQPSPQDHEDHHNNSET